MFVRTIVTALATLSLGIAAPASAQNHLGAGRKATTTVNLYPGVAPGSEGWTRVEVSTDEGPTRGRSIRNVVTPTLEAFLPDLNKATGAAVIVAPGGGFTTLGYDYEGTWVAQWLAHHGVAAFVLKYRVRETPAAMPPRQPPPPAPSAAVSPAPRPPFRLQGAELPIADGMRALRVVRERATEWGVDPSRLGFIGFSAGARVAVGVVAEGGQPAFVAPIYGGTFGDAVTFPKNIPPMFLAVAVDDRLAAETTNELYLQLYRAGEKPELHVYHKGSHGFGLQPIPGAASHWIDEFYWWMQSNGVLTRSTAAAGQ